VTARPPASSAAVAGSWRHDRGDQPGPDVVGVTRDLDPAGDLRRIDHFFDVAGDSGRRVEDGQGRDLGVIEAAGGEAVPVFVVSEEPGAASRSGFSPARSVAGQGLAG
jgi:hypothetical protein